MAIRVSLLKGTRDFGPDEIVKRRYITGIIQNTFENFAFAPIETPAMEKIETLTDKYGEEGNQLLFKLLNNGNFLNKASHEAFEYKDHKSFAKSISKRGLRYDLTIPFARYVVMNQNEISFPFKRYQIQNVWRADRPQKGRYQEFYQCDGDIIGTDSLCAEAELMRIFDIVFSKLDLKVEIQYNSRKVLLGMAEFLGWRHKFQDFAGILDKWDKIGIEEVIKELKALHFSEKNIEKLIQLLQNPSQLANVKNDTLQKGLNEIQSMESYLFSQNNSNKFVFDPKLARGLAYYTGCIFEVKSQQISLGSIAGGGRYDDLTGVFGLKNTSGVGISFGLERIYDIMTALNCFPKNLKSHRCDILLLSMDQESLKSSFAIADSLRLEGIRAELYPSHAKFKKQMKFANDIQAPYIAITGKDERETNSISLKNMSSGEQFRILVKDLISWLNARLRS